MIELLVVIVVFLIGILAVIQIFPKGFQLLVVTRNNSVAVHLAEDEVERLRQHADQLPEQIVSVRYLGGNTPVEYASRDPYDLSPQGDSVDSNGILSYNGNQIGNWLLNSGPNGFRRIVAETTRVPSPRPVGSNYGGLMLLDFGPIDSSAPLTAYSNDLTKSNLLPQLIQGPSQNFTVGSTALTTTTWDTPSTLANYEYFFDTVGQGLYLPTNNSFTRTYHIKAGVYLSSAGQTYRQDYTDLLVQIPPTTVTDASGNTPPLILVPFAAIIANTLPSGVSFVGADYDSLQVAPEYNLVANSNSFTGDPLEYKLLDNSVGVLLFSPSGYSSFVEKPGGAREPLLARVNYDVYDWRILHQEARVDSQLNLNGGNYGQIQLDLQSIKVGNLVGPDGLPNGGITPLEGSSSSYAATQTPLDDNMYIVDEQTGGILYEKDPNDGHQVVSINKSTGVVTIDGDGSGTGLPGYLAVPGTSSPVSVDLTGRALRVDYRGRNEYSVNVLKAASSYTVVYSPPPFSGEGQVYLNGNTMTFPAADRHQQVTVDTINYTDSSGVGHVLNGQTFTLQSSISSPGGLPQVNLNSALPSGATVTGVSGIKGVSIMAQVLWNPANLALTSSGTANINAIDTWEHNWRVNRTETTIPAQELQ